MHFAYNNSKFFSAFLLTFALRYF